MAVYITIIIVLYLSAFINFGKLNKAFYWGYVTILAIISGIRYYVGTDYQIQKNYYDWTLAGETELWLEPGFRLYIKWIDNLFGDFNAFIFIAAFFVVFAFGFSIYRNVEEKYHFFSLALFVTSTIYFATMNLERQYIAIGFLIFSFECFKNKKYIKTIIFFLLAYSFHESAISFLLFYAIYLWINWKGDVSKKYRLINIIMLISIIGIFVDIRSLVLKIGGYVIPESFMNYLNSRFFLEKDWDSILKFIIPNIIWVYLYYVYIPNNQKELKIKQYIPGYFLWLCINNFFYGVNVFLRIGMYFEWFILFVLPCIVEKGKNARSRFAIKIVILVYFLLLTSYSILYNGGHGVIPYQTIFDV